MDERVRQYGIIEVSEQIYSMDEPRPDAAAANYYPSVEWLDEQIRVLSDAAKGLFRPYEDKGWFFERLRSNIGLMEASAANGDAKNTIIHAIEVGRLMAEMKLKFDWEPDALRGRKIVEGAASTRIATDADRKALVEQLFAERDKGLRDAFRVAAHRCPEWGNRKFFPDRVLQKGVQGRRLDAFACHNLSSRQQTETAE